MLKYFFSQKKRTEINKDLIIHIVLSFVQKFNRIPNF